MPAQIGPEVSGEPETPNALDGRCTTSRVDPPSRNIVSGFAGESGIGGDHSHG